MFGGKRPLAINIANLQKM